MTFDWNRRAAMSPKGRPEGESAPKREARRVML